MTTESPTPAWAVPVDARQRRPARGRVQPLGRSERARQQRANAWSAAG